MPSDTNETTNSPATTYPLEAVERQTLLELNSAVAQQKIRIHDLNVELETAQRAREAATAMFQGALAMIANTHGMQGGQLSPDFTVITRQGK